MPAITTPSSSPFDIGISHARLLDAVRRAGSVARSELPERTYLSQQSVHRLTEDLLQRGLLRVEAPRISGRGKPSPQLALEADGAFGLGLAIDTDSVRLAITNLAGDLLHHGELDVPTFRPAAVTEAARDAFSALVRDYALSPERIAGIGVSVQGFRQTPGNVFMMPSPLDDWCATDMAICFNGLIAPGGTPLPAMVENNANLGAVAELWAGAGRRHTTFAYLSFNLGFGGGLILDGTLWHGHHLNAAEITSIYTEEEAARRPRLGLLLEMLRADGVKIPSVAILRKLYDPDWPTIDRWIERTTPALDQMIRAITGLIDPGAVVFGGEAPLDLRRRLMKAASPRPPDRLGRAIPGPQLLTSDLTTDPSVLGAALLPIRMRLFQ